jgi:hypothetical protein
MSEQAQTTAAATVAREEYDRAVERAHKMEAALVDKEKRLKNYEGLDPERVKAEREELEILRKQATGGDQKKIDELLSKAVSEAEQKVTKRFGEKLTELETLSSQQAKDLKHLRVTRGALETAAKIFIPEALKFVEPLIERSCDWVDGKIVVKDEKGEVRYSRKDPKTPMSVDELLGEFAEGHPFLVPSTTVRGSDNGAAKTAGTRGATKFPSDFEAWSMERKQTFFSENPELRKAYIRGAT